MPAPPIKTFEALRMSREEFTRQCWPAGIPHTAPVGAMATISLRAEINQGRWIVRCFNDSYAAPDGTRGCTSAQLASKSDPRFLCLNCLHVGTPAELRFVGVFFPPNADQIENVLEARPDPANRNWTTETVGQLLAENLAHGIGIGG
jgi:hypothetical protein